MNFFKLNFKRINMDKAVNEIKISQPYFQLLGDRNLDKKFRKLIITQAPTEFFSVLSQIIRHLVNGSFCIKNKDYCDKYKNTLYLLALPTTTLKDKKKIIISEDSDFINNLYNSFRKTVKIK